MKINDMIGWKIIINIIINKPCVANGGQDE